MKLQIVCVGRLRGELANAVTDYEARARRYFTLTVDEVKEETARSPSDADRVRNEEGKRLLARVGPGLELVALHRDGRAWTSQRLASYLSELAVNSAPGAAFLIGGAYGLSEEVLASARHRLSLSGFTLPHEMARLVLGEQIYRAGTIIRGEPYHKSR
jgi:23S rRNA (pseudouridine1915-N3)-methyltransferase